MLRDKYKNEKKRMKTRTADERLARLKTGGGTFEMGDYKPESEAHAELHAAIALSVHGLPSRHDEDGGDSNVNSKSSVGDASNMEVFVVDEQNVLISHSTVDASDIIASETESAKQIGESESPKLLAGSETIHSKLDSPQPSTSNNENLSAVNNEDLLVQKPSWDKYNVNMLKTPISKHLRANLANVSRNKRALSVLRDAEGESVVAVKKRLLEEDNKRADAEHKIRMEILQMELLHKKQVVKHVEIEHRLRMHTLGDQLKCDMRKRNEDDEVGSDEAG